MAAMAAEWRDFVPLKKQLADFAKITRLNKIMKIPSTKKQIPNKSQ